MCEANLGLIRAVQAEVDACLNSNPSRAFQLNRVLASMRRYPLPLRTNKEFLGLAGVNDAVADYLTTLSQRLYGSTYGEKVAPYVPVVTENPQPQPPVKRSRTASKKHDQSLSSSSTSLSASLSPSSSLSLSSSSTSSKSSTSSTYSDSSKSSTSSSVSNTDKPKPKPKVRAYTPRYGSGGFALMVALFEAKAFDKASGLSKNDLILRATPYSDTPFTVSASAAAVKHTRVTNPAACFSYTAWNSMKTIVEKGLVIKASKVYFLTRDGITLAEKLFELVKTKGAKSGSQPAGTSCSQTSSSSSLVSSVQSVSSYIDLCLRDETVSTPQPTLAMSFCITCGSKLIDGACFCHACGSRVTQQLMIQSHNKVVDSSLPSLSSSLSSSGSLSGTQSVCNKQNSSVIVVDKQSSSETAVPKLDPEDIVGVVLLLDTREVGAKSDRTYFETHLKQYGCKCETRNLRLGDFVWVARARNGKEYMLDYIIERKSFADFCSSIKSGHLEDQKHRIHLCPCSHRTVLVESSITPDDSLYEANKFSRAAVLSSLANTQFLHMFCVHTTLNIDDTIKYLVAMTNSFQTLARTPRGLARIIAHPLTTYEVFDQAAKPQTLRVQDAFAMQLLQVRRMPAEAALAISAEFGTMLSLWQRYQSEDPTKRSRLLQNLQATEGRKVGVKVSSGLSTLFTCKDYAAVAPTLSQAAIDNQIIN